MGNLITPFGHFIDLFFPRICLVCGEKLYQQEEILCSKCLYDLPRTNFHLEPKNQLEMMFWGRFPVEKATALLYFKKGSGYRKLIHQLKYKGKPGIGIFMGRLLAEDLSDWATGIDYIVPVPLHPKKKKIRGYNQSEIIANGLSEILKIPVDNQTLIRSTFTQTQTRKARYERWENVKSVFAVSNSQTFQGKHILLVDDVITTGATLEGSVQALLNIRDLKISIAAIGMASN